MVNQRASIRVRRNLLACAAALGSLLGVLHDATAGPWGPADDASLRSDLELLASVGAVDNIATHWPLPWAGLADRLADNAALTTQPDYIREVSDRLLQKAKSATSTGFHNGLFFDAAGSPATIRGYDAMGRQSLEGGAIFEYNWNSTSVHLSVGARSTNTFDRQSLNLDGSYLAQRIGGAILYAGYLPHWWGPGWMSAMSLSTNARPVPQIGISRASTTPFETPWLSWLGPWQLEFFVGVLDGPRVARNTIYDGLRLAFSPLPGLELGLSRTDMMCGSGHTCKPLAGYFDVRNDNSFVNTVSDQSAIDVRYTNSLAGLSFAVYSQLMAEDTNPIIHSGTSHLYGASVWHPVLDGIARLTIEYADSVASTDIFSGPAMHGFSYNNGTYADGMRYRGRTLGFSLDSDSRLMSVQAAFTDHADRSLTVTYHHARVSDPLNTWGNIVTTSSVRINEGQVRISFPLAWSAANLRFDIEGRLQDDQPRPHKGQLATVEAALKIGL